MKCVKRMAAMAVAVVVVCGLLACKKKEEAKKKELDTSDFIEVVFSGYEGMGVADLTVNLEKLDNEKRRIEAEFDDDKVEYSSAKMNSLFRSLSFELDKNTDLKNGDKVSVKFSYDKALADECKIEVVPVDFSFTVSNLKNFETVDAFDGLKVSFSGKETDATVVIDNSGCSDFVRNFVVFTVGDKEKQWDYDRVLLLKNGESISVSAKLGDNYDPEQGLCVLKEDTKEYIAAGLDMNPVSIQDLDIKPIVKNTADAGVARVGDFLFNDVLGRFSCEINGIQFIFNNSNVLVSQISDFSMKCEKAYFLQPKQNTDHQSGVLVLYHLKYKVVGEKFMLGDGGPAETEVDTYVGFYSFGFTSDCDQKTIVDLGEMQESEVDLAILNTTSLDVAMNAFVNSQMENYVLEELNLNDYKDVIAEK